MRGTVAKRLRRKAGFHPNEERQYREILMKRGATAMRRLRWARHRMVATLAVRLGLTPQAANGLVAAVPTQVVRRAALDPRARYQELKAAHKRH